MRKKVEGSEGVLDLLENIPVYASCRSWWMCEESTNELKWILMEQLTRNAVVFIHILINTSLAT